jgi:LysM repeat protein
MNRLNGIKDFIQSNFLSAVPIVLIAFIITGMFLFYSSTIDPAVRNRDQLIAQLADARKSVVNARGLSAQNPAELQSRLSSTQATLVASTNVFLSPAETSQITDALYQYADASRVTITDLSIQPSGAPSDKTSVSVSNMRLQAQGDSHQLVEFVSQIKEASSKGFIINNFSITQDKTGPKLTMDIALYTSQIAGSARLAGQLAPNASATSIPALPPAASLPPAATVALPTAIPLPPKATAVPPTATPGLLIQAPRKTVYLVRPGDTLTLIAHRYNTTVEALITSNDLLSSEVRVGQVLLVPMN